MKKMLFVLVAVASLMLSACNKQLLDFDYKFTKVHVFATNHCYNINSWTDYEDSDQIQVDVKGHGTVLFHSQQIALIEKTCPFCGF